MFSMIDWKLSLAILVLIWIAVYIFRQSHYANRLPSTVNTLDLMTPLIWWQIGLISFQKWQQSFLPYGWLMLVLWGSALLIYQGFGSGTYTPFRFFKKWWRIVDLASCLILGIFIFV
ncbi:DUF3397 family protein [Weissella kandleri]|uniref:DUF3397 family protein n=1 Tax=Weissella kandleri TaxID=1616 RepID=UPI00387EE6B4